MKKRTQHLFSAMILAGFVFIAFGSGDEEKNTETNTINNTDTLNKNNFYKISDNLEDFKNNFNQFMTNELGSNLIIRNVKIEEGSVNNTCTTELNNKIGLLFQINKEDNSIRSVTMIGQGDGTSKSGLNIFSTIGGLISASDKSLSPKERGNILKEIGLLSDIKNINEYEGSTVKNGLKYFINSSEQIGIMFGIQNANE